MCIYQELLIISNLLFSNITTYNILEQQLIDNQCLFSLAARRRDRTIRQNHRIRLGESDGNRYICTAFLSAVDHSANLRFS